MIVSSGFEAPDVGTHGSFATRGVLLSIEGCKVGCLLGGVVQTGVDGRGDGGELGPDRGLASCHGRGARDGIEITKVDTRAIRRGGRCFTVSREHHLLVCRVRRLLVDLVQSARDGLKHRGIGCLCHFALCF